MLNRQRSYAADFECLSELLVDQFVDDIAEGVTALRIKKCAPPNISADSKICLSTNSTSVANKTIATDDTPASLHKKTASRFTVDDLFMDAREVDTFTQKPTRADRCYCALAARTDNNTFRVHQEELRDAPPTTQLRLERICARLAAAQHDPASSNQSFVWTEYKHWILCLVNETDLYLQFELRQKGAKTCLTLFDDEAYFALAALIDCSENPRELIFEFSNPNSVLLRAHYSIIIYNLQFLLELKRRKIKVKTSSPQRKNSESIDVRTN